MARGLWPTQIAVETLQVLSGTPVDDYGDAAVDWSNPTVEETIERCSVQVVQGPEMTGDNREAITVRRQVWVPGFHPVLDGTKRVRWVRTGEVFRIDGDTPYQPDPFGLGLDHHTFVIEEVLG